MLEEVFLYEWHLWIQLVGLKDCLGSQGSILVAV